MFIPYLFKNIDQSIILVSEADEGGIYGYILYYFRKGKLLNKDYLHIAPIDDISINQFIEFEEIEDTIKVNVLTDQYYDTRLDKTKNSNNYNVRITYKSSKISTDGYSDYEPSYLKGTWAVNCPGELTELSIHNAEGFLSLYSPNAIYINLSVEKSSNPNEYILKFASVSSQKDYYDDMLKITEQDISKDKPLGKVRIKENGTAELHWTGFYNEKKQKLEFVGDDFLLIKEGGGKNPVQLEKCD